ncbi:Alpha/Beta hydrolase protein [Pestalotiopsis sp. NC0098]|nr:Alpha/Beta hydrolase protein [Pestalotiopsis sp. NC0098]
MLWPRPPCGMELWHRLTIPQTHICETTPGVKSYSGYVNLPADPAEGRAYDVHTFFWFFESRHDPASAPLALWLQGGPGTPSITAALGENGPCLVSNDSADTVLNPWSWNNEVNMLYMDQPVQVGFSYDVLVNGTVDEVVSPFLATPVESLASVNLSSTVLGGAFSSGNASSTASTTTAAAKAAWHFMQTWLTEFPHYKPDNNVFSIWAESYGGHYGPTFADYFEQQNSQISSGALDADTTIPLHLDTLGIVNGCLDMAVQMPFYPEMAYNNTWGIQAINETAYAAATAAWPRCRGLIDECRTLAASLDPLSTGASETVNDACAGAYEFCFDSMWQPYISSGREKFDITSPAGLAFPPKYAAGYLNRKEIQDELGVPLNFTGLSSAVMTAFTATGDFVLGRNVAVLGELLDRGVKVALVYGDRDFQCNWYGGEQISLDIQSRITDDFHGAKYADIQTNESYTGGLVRQFGNLSFSRVYDAGHEVPWYQPETAYRIFQRVMSNKDVATGTVSTEEGSCGAKPYSTSEGLDSIQSVMNDQQPAAHKHECYFWDMYETCSTDEKQMFQNGTAITKDYILIGHVGANGTAIYF